MTESGTIARTCACAPTWPRSPRPSTTSSRPQWARTSRVGTRVRVAAARPVGAGLGGRTRATCDDRPAGQSDVDLLPLKAWLGWGPPADLVELAEWAAWRWAGPSSFFLRVRLARGHRARAARAAPAPARGAGGAEPAPAARRRRRGRPPSRRARGETMVAAAADHRSHRPRAVGGRRPAATASRRAACWCSSRRRAGPSGWWPGWCGAAMRRRRTGSRPGPGGRSSSAAAPRRGHRSRSWPPPSCSMRTTRPTGRRAHPPTARSTS